jgi:arylsulfatase A-like enzyme
MMKPNIIFIYADDLGHGMLSCYGQTHFRTPNIDRIAQEGMRFTRAYGTAFCAPARACLLTGMHDAHAGRWTFNQANLYEEHDTGAFELEQVFELINNTGIRPKDGQTFLPTVAQKAGLYTGQIGKLEWGFCTSPQELQAHGWDYHYGYYDHGQCHGFYPHYVFENGQKIDFPENTAWRCGAGQYTPFVDGVVPHDPTGRVTYSQDLFDKKIVEFIEANQDRPFFLYHPSQLPHGPTYFPDHHPDVAAHPDLTPVEREYASMVLRLDQTVGLILDTLDRLGLTERTMVMFASDNGHETNYEQPGRCSHAMDLQGNPVDELTTKFHAETCGDVFNGNGGLAGLKRTNWEGGARVPLLVRWPESRLCGQTSGHLVSNYDTLATIADVLDVSLHCETDGISYLPVLRGAAEAPQHSHIVYASYYGPSLVRADGWKLRTFVRRDKIADFSMFGTTMERMEDAIVCQLYNLHDDPAEKTDVSDAHPLLVKKMLGDLMLACDGNLLHGLPEAHFAFFDRNRFREIGKEVAPA